MNKIFIAVCLLSFSVVVWADDSKINDFSGTWQLKEQNKSCGTDISIWNFNNEYGILCLDNSDPCKHAIELITHERSFDTPYPHIEVTILEKNTMSLPRRGR